MTVTELDRALVAGDAGRVTGKPQERPDPEEIGIECLRAASAPASPDPSPDGSGQGDATASVPAGLIGSTARQAEQAALVTAALAETEHQILAKVLQVVSGPGGVASFLRRIPAGPGPERPVAAAGCGPERRHPGAPAAPGRCAGSALPVRRGL
jgi:hypothetical protein